MTNKVHEGHNVKRFREMLRIEQNVLAAKLGDDWTPKKISLLEEKESIEPALLQQIAGVLEMPVAAFQNFKEEATVNITANSITNSGSGMANGYQQNDGCNFNNVDELIKMSEKQIAIYERMLIARGDLPSDWKVID